MNPSAGNHCWSEEYCREQSVYICSVLIPFPGISFWPLRKTGHWSRWNFGVTQKRHFCGCDVSCHYREQLPWAPSFSRKFTHGDGVNISSHPHPPGKGYNELASKIPEPKLVKEDHEQGLFWVKHSLHCAEKAAILPDKLQLRKADGDAVFSQVLFSMKC